MPARPVDRVLSARSALHRALFRASGGRLLARWGGIPVVLLTTTGRRSGRPRTTVLVAPVRLGDAAVVVASNGGSARHPAWYLNLRARPDAEVLFDRTRRHVRARVVGGAERTELWRQITTAAPAYARYQARSPREIPVIVLEPRPPR